MAKQVLTPWFTPEVKPARPGVYIASVSPKVHFYRRWDGRHWYYGSYTSPRAAAKMDRKWSDHLFPIHWRGLAEQPK